MFASATYSVVFLKSSKMKCCYNKLVIFIFTLLFNNAKLNSLPQIHRISSSSSLEHRNYAFYPTTITGNNVALVNTVKLDGEMDRPLSIGWSRVVTTVENYRGKILEHVIDYEVSLQSSFDLFSTEDTSAIDIYKARNQIIKEKDFTFCDPGPCYCNKIFTITVNPKRNTLDIKPSLEALRQIMINFSPIKPEVQAVISMILNANLPEDQLSLSKKIIALIHKHLAFDLENLEISESAEVYDEGNLVKYVNANGVYCYRKLGTNLQPVPCPMDTSLIPLYNLDSYNTVPVKYVDSNGMVHCFDMSDYDLRQITCPLHTSLLPEIGIKKYLDDNNREYCSVINEVTSVHFICPKSLSSLPLTVMEDLQNAIVKYVDPQGRLRCYLKNNIAFSETECPENSLNLPTFNPYKNFVKYVDSQGRSHCFYKNDDSLQPIVCPADLSQIRHISLNNEAMPIKHIGPDGMIHCFTYGASRFYERQCPDDTSLFPLMSLHDLDDIMFKHTDFQGKVRCYKKTGNNYNLVNCPRDTSLIPEVSILKQNIPDLDLVPGFRPPFGRDSGIPRRVPTLPLDSLYGPLGKGYYSDQDLVKYVDATGEYCYRKLGTTLQPVQCPMDTSLIPHHNLDSDTAIPVKYVDSNGRVHCFDMNNYDIRARMCPLDTSLLPEIGVKKYLDDNNIEFCSVINEVTSVHFICPKSLSSLPLTSMENIENIIVKATDSQGRVRCYRKTANNFSPVNCPRDTSLLPEVNPLKQNIPDFDLVSGFRPPFGRDYGIPRRVPTLPLDSLYGPLGKGYYSDQDIVKYVDATGEYCYRKLGTTLQPVQCPMDTSLIPHHHLDSDIAIPVKYVDSNGRVHCFDMNNYEVRERMCPLDTSLLPEIGVKKYLDDNNVEFCSVINEVTSVHFICPKSLSSLPLTSMEDIENIIVKATDSQGRVRCYRKTANNFSPVNCPRDTSLLPEVNPLKQNIPDFDLGPGFRPPFGRDYGIPQRVPTLPLDSLYGPLGKGYYSDENLVKYVDATGEYCYRKLGTTLHPVQCPMDTSLIPHHNLDSDIAIPVKYVDSNGRVHCFDMNNYNIRERMCPLDTSLLPEIGVKKYLDDNNIEFCSVINEVTSVHFICPKSLSSLPLTSLEDIENIIVKATDSQGRVRCYRKTVNNFHPVNCPRGTSLFPVVNPLKQNIPDFDLGPGFRPPFGRDYEIPRRVPTLPLDSLYGPLGKGYYSDQDLVKYVDATGEYCYRKLGTTLQPVQCPMDTSLIPHHNLDSDIAIPVKYVDSNGRVHCFDMNNYAIRARMCPLDTSLLPEIGVKKYLDDNNVEFCSVVNEVTAVHFICPKTLSSLPLTPMEDIENIIVKATDSQGRVRCYRKTANNFHPVNCPRDTSLLPEVNPLKQNIPDFDLVSGFRPPFGRDYGIPRRVPTLPLDSLYGPLGKGYYSDQDIVKYVDATGEYCYRKLGTTLQPVQCPMDTSLIPHHNLDSDIAIPVKYVDSNGRVHCFDMNNYAIRARMCPLDTSLLPEIGVKKYLDDNNVEFCSVVNEITAVHFICPKTLSSLPLTPMEDIENIIVKATDSQGRVRCYRKTANNFHPVNCPRDTSLLPEVNPLKQNIPDFDLVSGFRPPFGRDYGIPRRVPTLPLDSLYGPLGKGYYSDQDIVKYVDATGEYCYRKLGTTLQPVQCPMDTSLIPHHNLDSDIAIPVKYVDSNGRVHCFDMNNYAIRARMCPLDTSLLPEIGVKKYLDDNNVEFCSVVNEVTSVHFICPKSLSSLPLTSLEDIENIIVKATDSQGRVRCYRKTVNNFHPVNCPRDTSLLPEVNPLKQNIPDFDLVPGFRPPFGKDYGIPRRVPTLPLDSLYGPLGKGYYSDQDLVKYVDATGEYCYRKLGTTLQPVQCPMDTSLIPHHNLDSDIAIPVKYVDSNGRVHCFDMNNYAIRARMCPLDTSLLPEIGVKKYLDDNNVEFCSVVNEVTSVHFICPKSLSSLPLTSLEDIENIIVKATDSQGRVRCYRKTVNNFHPVNCPRDTSLFPVVNPLKQNIPDFDLVPGFRPPFGKDYGIPRRVPTLPLDSLYGPLGNGYYSDQDLVKYVDANGEYCYRKLGTTLQPVQCPMDTSLIPHHNLDSDIAIPVKYVDSNGRVHCFDMNNYAIRARMCPLDTSLLPEIGVKKYLDDNNVEFCSVINEVTSVHFICPKSLSSLPLTSMEDIENIIVKATDSQGRVRCYRKTVNNFHPVNCPRDTSLLPEVNPLKQNIPDFDLGPGFRPPFGRDYGIPRRVPTLPLDSLYGPLGNGYYSDQDLVKYVDATGEYCYRKLGTTLQPVQCPMDTSLIPHHNLDSDIAIPVKYVDSNGRVHCFDMNNYDLRPRNCPLDTSLLPEINVKKYLDDNNREHCSVFNGVSTIQFACPRSLSSHPLTPLDAIEDIVVKNTDMHGRVRCYRKTATNFNSVICPRDTSMLPEINPFKNLNFGPEFRPPSFGRDRGISRPAFGMNTKLGTSIEDVQNGPIRYRDPQGFGFGRNPLMDIITGLNIGKGSGNFSPGGSGEIQVTYNDLMTLIKHMCKKV